MWIGDHPGLPAFAEVGGAGGDVAPLAETTGARLPFLMKVLAAAECLSIQVHPDEQQARQGYDDEQRRGVPVSDPARNYKDASHKPELIVALTPFWSLDGFRPLREIVAALEDEAPELRPLMPDIAARAERAGDDAAARAAVVSELYERAMRLPQEARNELLTPLIERLERQHAAAPFPDGSREHWVLETDRRYARGADKDRGVLSLYLLNFVTLAPGQALFLGAGELHSYLRGVGVEVMANSDNVIRGGLTPKHVDVEALLSIVKFKDGPARVIEPDASGVYATPAREFEVARLRLAGGQQASRPSASRRRHLAGDRRTRRDRLERWRRGRRHGRPRAGARWRWAATRSAPSATTRSCFARRRRAPSAYKQPRVRYGGAGASGDVMSSRMRLSTRNTPGCFARVLHGAIARDAARRPPVSVTRPLSETMLIRDRFTTGSSLNFVRMSPTMMCVRISCRRAVGGQVHLDQPPCPADVPLLGAPP